MTRPALRKLPALALIGLAPTIAVRFLLSGSAPAQAQVDQQIQQGFDLYAAGCSTCHGVMGEGSPQGPPLVGVGTASVDFMLSTGRMPLADPEQQPTRKTPKLAPEEIAAIVAYVASLGPGGAEIPQVSPATGDVARGREVYVANCLACHGAGAQGASVGGGAVAPSLDGATTTQLAEAARIGPGVMPVFGEDVIDERDMDSLVAYVLSLRSGQDRGGLGLGHVGPVLEGLIGWLVGMGILVVVIRLTGTRT